MRFSDLEQSVLAEIRPTWDELDRMYALADRLIADIQASGKADGMMVGSVARKTCVHGDRDLDVFMLFDPSLPREDLEREGLALAWNIAKQYTDTIREKYAEHPYLNATIEGLDVDLVPCYQVQEATGIQSAVDRTPFHNRYIKARIDQYTDDVLLLKQFVKAGGVYGSDQMTEGFAGYLCELLILYHGGFHDLLKEATQWKPGKFIDIEQHASKWFEEPLVVIDPVDPCRNVSASVSETKLLEFIEKCQSFLEMAPECGIKSSINPDFPGIGNRYKKIRGFIPIGREPDNGSLQGYHLTEQFSCHFGTFSHGTKSNGVFTIRKSNQSYLVRTDLCIQNP